jgi:hypothetical protein
MSLPDHLERTFRTPRCLLDVVHPLLNHKRLAVVLTVLPPVVSVGRVCAQFHDLCVAPTVRDPLSRCAVSLGRYEDFVALESGSAYALVGILLWDHDIVGEFPIFLLAAEHFDSLVDARKSFAALCRTFEVGCC